MIRKKRLKILLTKVLSNIIGNKKKKPENKWSKS